MLPVRVFELARRGDDAADGDPLAVLDLRQLAERPVHDGQQRLADLLERVHREEQPDRVLLVRQQLVLLELGGRDRRVRGTGEGRGCAVGWVGAVSLRFEEVEDRPLPDLGVLLDLLAGALRLLQDLQHALARRAGRAEGPALDQRLDRALVDGLGVDALAELPDRGELAALLAGALDRLDRGVADALDGVEPEADVAVDHDELVVGEVDVGREDLDPHLLAAAAKNGTLSLVSITEEISAAMYSAQ